VPLPLPQFFLKDPLYMGLFASLATLVVVSLFTRKKAAAGAPGREP
jgi:hypothetical protein